MTYIVNFVLAVFLVVYYAGSSLGIVVLDAVCSVDETASVVIEAIRDIEPKPRPRESWIIPTGFTLFVERSSKYQRRSGQALSIESRNDWNYVVPWDPG